MTIPLPLPYQKTGSQPQEVAQLLALLTAQATAINNLGTTSWPMIKNSTLASDTVIIASGSQMICVRTFVNAGTIINNGLFAILDT